MKRNHSANDSNTKEHQPTPMIGNLRGNQEKSQFSKPTGSLKTNQFH
jgi:hypothetical protein